MYAVTFDLNGPVRKAMYESTGAHTEIRNFLENKGFKWVQRSVYFSNPGVNAVQAVLIVQELIEEFDWLGPCIDDIRLLRIEDDNDLKPVCNYAYERKHKTSINEKRAKIEESLSPDDDDEKS